MKEPTAIMKAVTMKKGAQTRNAIIGVKKAVKCKVQVKPSKKDAEKSDVLQGDKKPAARNLRPTKKDLQTNDVFKDVKKAATSEVMRKEGSATNLPSTKDDRKERGVFKKRIGKIAITVKKKPKKSQGTVCSKAKPAQMEVEFCIIC